MIKKFHFLAPALAIGLLACKSKQQKLIEQLTPIVTNAVKADSSIEKIDSLTIYKVDTLSDAIVAKKHIANQYDKIEYYLDMSKSLSSQAQLEGSQAQLNRQQAALYGGVLESETLKQMADDDADNKMKDFKEHIQKAQLYLDSSKLLQKETDELDSKLKAKKINNKNFKGYVVYFNLLGSDKKNLEVRKDSMVTYISPSLRIIPFRSF